MTGLPRLGKNKGGYGGETIDIEHCLSEVDQAARQHEWESEFFLETDSLKLRALRKTPVTPAKRIYISTGIHGDEPAGPLAVLQMLREDRWPSNVGFWLCPCLNPAGFALNRRENGNGIDLNRQYLEPRAAEVRAHIAWLNRQPSFDLALCLHEDWESHGFYLYELNPDNQRSFAELIVRYVAEVCPIDYSPVIEGREAHDGIVRPSADPRSRPEWPEAFYLFTKKTRLSYTLEAPSDFPLSTRVAALVAGVRAVLDDIQS